MAIPGPRLLIFAMLLLLLAPPALTLTIEADSARIKTVGELQDGCWNLWSLGEWGDFVFFDAPGTYRILVRAYGSPVKSVWPLMALSVDGVIERMISVEKRRVQEYEFRIEADAGLHRIAVVFMNDAVVDNEDRNLYIEGAEILSLEGAHDPLLGDEKDWWKEQARLEEDALKNAARSIEVHRKSSGTLRVLDAEGRPVKGALVTVEQVRHDFLFGGNIYAFDRFEDPLKNALYKERFRELFNYATVGFYWRSYEREQGKPDYDYTDKVAAWCNLHGIRCKGHPLLWDHESGRPVWAEGQPTAELRQKRVNDIIRRFSGWIDFWEVVNEPAHCEALKIDDPYRWAREADPNAHLIVNDYHVLSDGCLPFFDLLREARSRGVPFDGIGIQAHEPTSMRFPLDRVQRILDMYASLGSDLHITEFTPTSSGRPITGSHVAGNWDEAAQADYAVKFYTLCFSHPAVVAVTWWDLCDTRSWLEGGGLLREDLSPKPAYTLLKKLIHEKWHTRLQGTTDDRGSFAFRGFLGTYIAKVEKDGAIVEKNLHLNKGRGETITFTLQDREGAFKKAAANGKLANEGFKRCGRYVEGWLKHADPKTGLIPCNFKKDYWNAKNSAADNYPFMVLTASLIDRELFHGRMLEMLRTEEKLTSRIHSLPDTYSFSKQGFRDEEPDLARILFGASEYVKDGLLPLTEWLGASPWRDRMIDILDDMWRCAPIDTPFGAIVSTDVEVNGEMLQALSRVYWMTKDKKYLEWALRLGDFYLLGKHHPTRDQGRLKLRDHGCEIVSGLCELYATVSFAAPEKKRAYQAPIHEMLDRILQVGRNEHGLFYDIIKPRTGEIIRDRAADTWGYTFNGIYTVYLIDGTEAYREATLKALGSLSAHYRNYNWEKESSDGYADSIESALNLYNREPLPAVEAWIDSEIQVMWGKQKPDGVIEGWHCDGNFARTTLMYCLWKTKGLTLHPWREDIRFGALREGDTLLVSLVSEQDWQGRLHFDEPRHETVMGLPLDWPRINQFPEWYTNRQLREGLAMELKAGVERRLQIK